MSTLQLLPVMQMREERQRTSVAAEAMAAHRGCLIEVTGSRQAKVMPEGRTCTGTS